MTTANATPIEATQFRTDKQTKDVPVEALRFDCGPMQFVDAGEVVDNEAPIRMLARSAEPIEHWYWGKIVHDMAGMKLRKDRVPIDWCHNDYLNLGYLDQFEATNDGLTVEGKLIAFTAGDRASEVIHRGRKGVPYESSIDFRGGVLRIEELGQGVEAEVNGYTLEGPAVIVREWTLRAVAVCPYGADPNTVSQFAGQDNPSTSLSIEVFQMTKSASGTPTDANPPADAQQHADDGGQKPGEGTSTESSTVDRNAFTGELDRYIEAFGTENGLEWFKGGKTFAEATELHAKQLAAALAEKEASTAKQLEELKAAHEKQLAERDAKLKQLGESLGEEHPASFGDGEGDAGGENKFANKLGKNLGAFASGIEKRMPTK